MLLLLDDLLDLALPLNLLLELNFFLECLGHICFGHCQFLSSKLLSLLNYRNEPLLLSGVKCNFVHSLRFKVAGRNHLLRVAHTPPHNRVVRCRGVIILAGSWQRYIQELLIELHRFELVVCL